MVFRKYNNYTKRGYWENSLSINFRYLIRTFFILQDVNREGLVYDVHDLERWLERLIDMIDRGYAFKKLEASYRSAVGTQ